MSKIIDNIINDKHENYILPFFWQHGEDEATLREYMKVISEANIGAVCVESRPHPDFCGDKWWQDMDVILEEAKSRNMKVWILDDSHFPTGFANGAMANEPLSKARKSICCQKYELKAGETLELSAEDLKHPAERVLTEMEKQIGQVTGNSIELIPQSEFEDDELIGISVAFSDGGAEDLQALINADGSLEYTTSKDCIIYKMNSTRNRGAHKGYINMVDEASVRVLIDAVYEKHLEHYKDYFGNVIEGFFSDEPELGNGHLYELHHEMGLGFDMDYPWSMELAQALKDEMGADFATNLPLIWETTGDEKKRASSRLTYMDKLTRLVEKNFSYQIGNWCRSHGVKYIGHIIEDNGQHCRTGSTLGHYFRSLKGQDWAGIDDIGGQVYPMGENDNFDMGVFRIRNGNFYHFLLGKLANSLAALDPKKQGNAMCEIFGAYGWEEGLRLEKYLADHFMVRGVNHFVPHAFSAKPFPDPDCPPHFYAHGHNPEYKAFGELMKYMNRTCELISGGKHISPVAVMYHGEAEWAGKCMPDEIVTRQLAENQIEFDIVPQDIFVEREEYKTSTANGKLVVGTQEYGAVVIPYVQFVNEPFAKGIKEMLDAEIRVYFVDKSPESVISDSFSVSELKDAKLIKTAELSTVLSDLVDLAISPANTYIRYYHYVKDNTDLYMLVNEGDKIFEGKITVSDRYAEVKGKSVFAYDAWNNLIHKTDIVDGCGNISLKPNESSILIIVNDEENVKLLESKAVPKVVIPAEAKAINMSGKWMRSITKSVNYPNFEKQEEVNLPDDYAKVDPEFSGWFRYENSFNTDSSKAYYLEITDAFEVVDLYINGEKLQTQIFAPFIYDISKYVKDGENKVCIEVATTLEREMLKVPDMFGRPKPEPKYGSGITGEVKIYGV